MLYEMMTLMNFLSFPAIDFDFIWSRHMTWVTPTTAQPKQPLATQQQPHTEHTDLKRRFQSKIEINAKIL